MDWGKGNYLFISDLQMPFEHARALEFCIQVKKEFRIPKENVYCVGDETDQYYGGLYKKNPDAVHSPTTELQAAREKLQGWFAAFPEMKLATSNHGTRWLRKALDAEIPSELLRKYEEMLAAPKGWRWKKHWLVPSSHPILVEHGDDYGGGTPHLAAAMSNGISTVIGHHHSLAGIEHIRTNGMNVWGMVTGSLIDFEAYAFDYARNARKKPLKGVGVAISGGACPLWIPLPEAL